MTARMHFITNNSLNNFNLLKDWLLLSYLESSWYTNYFILFNYGSPSNFKYIYLESWLSFLLTAFLRCVEGLSLNETNRQIIF